MDGQKFCIWENPLTGLGIFWQETLNKIHINSILVFKNYSAPIGTFEIMFDVFISGPRNVYFARCPGSFHPTCKVYCISPNIVGHFCMPNHSSNHLTCMNTYSYIPARFASKRFFKICFLNKR